MLVGGGFIRAQSINWLMVDQNIQQYIVEYIIAKPIALFLDCLLGIHNSTIYNRKELKVMARVHFEDEHGGITEDEFKVMEGVLEMYDK